MLKVITPSSSICPKCQQIGLLVETQPRVVECSVFCSCGFRADWDGENWNELKELSPNATKETVEGVEK